MRRLFALSLLCAAYMGVPVDAQVLGFSVSHDDTMRYGRIEGIVIDKDTKEPLPGAVVLILGTELGANTDLDGRYCIVHVPAGSYTVEARMLGFASISLKERVVRADSVTDCIVMLPVAPIDIHFDWGCPSPMVHPDRTSSWHIWNEREINKLPGH